ncbi:MAG: signal peptidase II [Candidatus Cloacimonetes bacterium]|nr:signal peptidase II [Candidatus Cloacimonadota bacterium]
MIPPLTKLKIAPAVLIMLLLLVLDQLSKTVVRLYMDLHQSIPLLKGFFGDTFMLIYVQNTGAAFSLGFNSDLVNRIFFITVTILALFFIVYLLRRSQHRIQIYAFGFVLGGAVGNLIDRIVYGGVTDFISVDFPDFIMQRFPIFNVADSSIFIGVCLLIVDMLFIKDIPEPDPETPLTEITTKEI